ncbi:MAG: FMN-binding negative transcriptional regulator [Nitrososphaerota archaeon]|nr:FMN-binding negative transcriptional regulator [Nitrososphaerota archaeon]
MYNPRWFKEDRLRFLREEIGRIGFGSFVTLGKSGILVSHVPMILDSSGRGNGLLYGHIARGNHQWRDTISGSEGLAMFLGPDAYITPRWYETKKQDGKVVPTWNYVAIHARGPVTFFDDPEQLRELVTKLTRKHESDASEPWEVSDAPEDYVSTELKMIVGFRMQITRIEGKRKMSQNRPEADIEGVISGLAERNRIRDHEVSAQMRALGHPQE